MRLRILWLPLCCILLCSTGCSGKDVILHGYEKVVSTMGALTRTKKSDLIGTRTDGKDDYTGAYAAACKAARGKDVVFGGCDLQTRQLHITGSVSCQAGIIQIMIKNGSEEIYVTPDAKGNIAEEITGTGGDWYLIVDYADFTGTVSLCSSYIAS